MFITIPIYRALLKAAVIVIPLLGCTWIFGLLAINDNTVVFAWIFTIFNSLQVLLYPVMVFLFSHNTFQGLFIMFFYVLRNDKV